MQIFADPITVNCRKVIAGLQMMGIDYELDIIDYFNGEQKSERYIALNPNASLPALKDGDLVLWESNAMLTYAADKHGKTEFYPTAPGARADHNRWLFWESAHWFPSCYVYLVENCVKPLLGHETDQAAIDAERARFDMLAGILDERLKARKYIMGDTPTIADVVVAAPMHLHRWQQLPLGGFKSLKAWMVERVEPLPYWKATHVEEGFKLPEA